MKKLLLMSIIVSAGFLNAENLIKNSTNDWENVIIVKKGDKEWLQNKKPMVINKALIPVDMNAKYRLSGKIMLGEPAPKNFIFLGLTPHCDKKKPIKIWQVKAIKGTGTKLADDYKAGSKILKIKDASKWKINKYNLIAFNVDNSGKFSDLPNRNTPKCAISKIEKKDSYWEVTMATPFNQNHAVNTKVRLHAYGDHHIYAITLKPSNLSASEPKEFSAIISGEAKSGGPKFMFWRGTKFVNVFVWASGGKNAKVLFSDIKLEKIQ